MSPGLRPQTCDVWRGMEPVGGQVSAGFVGCLDSLPPGLVVLAEGLQAAPQLPASFLHGCAVQVRRGAGC